MIMKKTALIVEDNASFRLFLKEALKDRFEISEASTINYARKALNDKVFDLVLLDVKLPDGKGTDIIQEASELSPQSKIIVITAFGDIPLAIESVKRGAVDFYQKPIDYDVLMSKLERIFPDNSNIETDAERIIYGTSAKTIEVRKKAIAAACTDVNVCITGDSGAGKEFIARAIHALSSRKSKNFAIMDITSISSNLMESELFGTVKGAYSGADKSRDGRVGAADGGTLFIDNIDDADMETQGKIIRFVETKKYYPVGGTQEKCIDVKLIFASKSELSEMVENGEFRRDLYFRINVFPITAPLLAERREDIFLIAEHFLSEAQEKNRIARKLSESVKKSMIEYSWPGNVRELKNDIERYVITGDESIFTNKNDKVYIGETLKDRVETVKKNYERTEILNALKASGGNKKSASRMLKTSYRNLLEKIKEYQIDDK